MIRKAILIARLPVETLFGLLYMSGMLLVPSILRGSVASILVGYLGMPRRVNGVPANQVNFKVIEYGAMLAGLLCVSFLVANGLLWFKDVHRIIQRLRRNNS